jgi:hypothetical protein
MVQLAFHSAWRVVIVQIEKFLSSVMNSENEGKWMVTD